MPFSQCLNWHLSGLKTTVVRKINFTSLNLCAISTFFMATCCFTLVKLYCQTRRSCISHSPTSVMLNNLQCWYSFPPLLQTGPCKRQGTKRMLFCSSHTYDNPPLRDFVTYLNKLPSACLEHLHVFPHIPTPALNHLQCMCFKPKSTIVLWYCHTVLTTIN